MWTLTIEDDQGVTTRVELARDAYSVGRDPACDICLVDRDISRRHATLRALAGRDGWEFLAHDSRNGCRLNGRRVNARAIMAHGDRLQVGDYRLTLADGAASPRERGGVAGPPPPRPRAKVDRLVVIEGAEAGRELRLDGGPVTIGGGPGCHVTLSDPALRFVVRPLGGRRYEIINVGPRAELSVNFAPVWRTLLDDGDRVEVPGEVALRFLRGAPAAAAEDGSPPPSARAEGAPPERGRAEPSPARPSGRVAMPPPAPSSRRRDDAPGPRPALASRPAFVDRPSSPGPLSRLPGGERPSSPGPLSRPPGDRPWSPPLPLRPSGPDRASLPGPLSHAPGSDRPSLPGPLSHVPASERPGPSSHGPHGAPLPGPSSYPPRGDRPSLPGPSSRPAGSVRPSYPALSQRPPASERRSQPAPLLPAPASERPSQSAPPQPAPASERPSRAVPAALLSGGEGPPPARFESEPQSGSSPSARPPGGERPSRPSGKGRHAANTLDGQVKGLDETQADAIFVPTSLSKLAAAQGALTEDSFQYSTAEYPRAGAASSHVAAGARRGGRARAIVPTAVVLLALATGTTLARRLHVARSPAAKPAPAADARALRLAAPASLSLEPPTVGPGAGGAGAAASATGSAPANGSARAGRRPAP